MPVFLKGRNGEITEFRNAGFIPAFYFIPKRILDKCGTELNSIPRNPRKLLHDLNAIAKVESDLFILAIIDAYEYMVWPFVDENFGYVSEFEILVNDKKLCSDDYFRSTLKECCKAFPSVSQEDTEEILSALHRFIPIQ